MIRLVVFLLTVIIISASLVYFTVAIWRRHKTVIGYNSIPLFLMSLFMGGYLIYIDEGGSQGNGGWKNFSGFGNWLFVALFTLVFLFLFTGLYVLVNRQKKLKT